VTHLGLREEVVIKWVTFIVSFIASLAKSGSCWVRWLFLLRDMTTQIAVQSTCIINNHVSSFYCSGAKTIGSGVGVAVGVSVGFGVSVGVRV